MDIAKRNKIAIISCLCLKPLTSMILQFDHMTGKKPCPVKGICVVSQLFSRTLTLGILG
jgi:hypothetical protein